MSEEKPTIGDVIKDILTKTTVQALIALMLVVSFIIFVAVEISIPESFVTLVAMGVSFYLGRSSVPNGGEPQ